MSRAFVTDEEASDSLHYLVNNAGILGEAARRRSLAESMTKRVKAIEMARSSATTVSAKEQDALASEAYLKAIEDEAQAVGDYETLRALKDAAMARIDAWRSITATQRSIRAA